MPRQCQFINCRCQATFGLEWMKAIYCATHKTGDMIDVIHKRCGFNDCILLPSFGVQLHRPIYCFKHKPEGAINVVSKRCLIENCVRHPTFGFEFHKPIYCSEHKPEGAIDVINKRCLIENCISRPSFGNQFHRPIYCSEHKLDGMINVVNKRCFFANCNNVPHFGNQFCKPIYCSKHKLDGMIDVKNKRCLFTGCTRYPSFGNQFHRPIYCAEHKIDGMIYVIRKLCIFTDCTSVPSFGTHITGKIHCSKHANKKTEWKITKCNHSRLCKNIAIRSITGKFPYEFCDNLGHYPTGYTSIFSGVCKKCGLTDCIIDSEDLCLDTCTSKHASRQKSSENEMEFVFNSANFPIKFIRDKIPYVNGCIKERPDFVFDLGYGILIVENDEEQHQSRLKECEKRRMINIHAEYGQSVHFIRFNPHSYDKGVDNTPIKRRYSELVKKIDQIIRDARQFFEDNSQLTVRYMFYNGQLKGIYPIERIDYCV